MKTTNNEGVRYEPFTQADFEEMCKVYAKEMSIIDFIFKNMSPALQVEVDKACIEYVKSWDLQNKK